MNKKDAMKWIKALRSGKYKQGSGRLYNPETDSYCCLGVADKIFKLGERHPTRLYNTREKIGLSDCLGRIGNIPLTQLNDNGLSSYETEIEEIQNKPFTFDEIADIIQIEYVEGVSDECL